MTSRISSVGILINIIILVLASTACQLSTVSIPENVVISETTRQAVLNATIKINLLAPAIDENGQAIVNVVDGEKQAVYRGGTGLGTVVRAHGEIVLVTHDHWTLMNDPNVIVELVTAQGDLLATLSGPELHSLIRHRDGGTTIIDLPAGLANHVEPAKTNSIIPVAQNDVLTIAYRNQDDSVSVVATVVSEVAESDGLAMVEMTSVGGEIIYTGNSGGGVWADNRLVANIWATVLTQGEAGDDVNPTERSRAALLPAGL